MRNPELVVHVYEREPEPMWKHHWSFNLTDIAPSMRDSVAPLIEKQWSRYDVVFPERERTLDIGYASTNDLRLDAHLYDLRRSGRIVMHRGVEISPEEISAGAVLDARGYRDRNDTLEGYQKFVGLRVKTTEPHNIAHPIIMDATVEQVDGYRFFYLLPFSDTEILVEDTYFSDTPNLSENEIVSRIHDYIATKGWEIDEVIHREKGVLPMTTATARHDGGTEIGLRGGFAVSATGFTFPVALELAEHVAQEVARAGVSAAPKAVAEFRKRYIRRERYARLLNRMFFGAAVPHRRYVILQRFYGLRQGLIERFYRNGLTVWDKARILIGKPPVPVTRALYNLSEKAFMRRHLKRSPHESDR